MRGVNPVYLSRLKKEIEAERKEMLRTRESLKSNGSSQKEKERVRE